MWRYLVSEAEVMMIAEWKDRTPEIRVFPGFPTTSMIRSRDSALSFIPTPRTVPNDQHPPMTSKKTAP